MRILLWHGYLLDGTGSNVYTRSLAREWSLAGHEVVVVSQEPDPARYDIGGAATVRPELPGGLLPVFVLDRYTGLEPRLLQDFTARERTAYVEANAAALRDLLPADIVFLNHVLMGAAVGAALGRPFRVKAHGSELEYSMRGRPELEEWGRRSLEGAEAVYVGSRHIREVLEDVVGHVERVVEVPPGVDVDEFVPQPRAEALADLLEEAALDAPNAGNRNERLPDGGNAARLAAFFAEDAPTVVYFGKLIENKGVQLLLEALESLDARAVVVGFGDYRGELERQAGRLPPARCSSPGRSSTATSSICSLWPTPRSCRRSSRRRSAWLRRRPPPAAARRSSPGTAGSPRSPPGSRRPIRRRCAASPRSRPAMRPTCGRSSPRSSDCRPSERDAVRSAARRTVEARWSWASVAARLLAPVA